jgi:hypothetical protein
MRTGTIVFAFAFLLFASFTAFAQQPAPGAAPATAAPATETPAATPAPAAPAAEPKIDTGDTAWMRTSAASSADRRPSRVCSCSTADWSARRTSSDVHAELHHGGVDHRSMIVIGYSLAFANDPAFGGPGWV